MGDHEYGTMQTGDYRFRFSGGGPQYPIHVTAHYNDSIQEPVMIRGAHTDSPVPMWSLAWYPGETGAAFRRHIEQQALDAYREYWARMEAKACSG